ncbi:hypothetical protein SDC9_209796 [bioreactor metagenome]|uniref:Uncharacterized protein n=1 Tax=bioreactor metagenome TaxID=1076179 RepID=A0A645JG22_9ZZZZ
MLQQLMGVALDTSRWQNKHTADTDLLHERRVMANHDNGPLIYAEIPPDDRLRIGVKMVSGFI